MTILEAIDTLELHNPFLGTDKNLTEAFDIAIKALTAQQWIPFKTRPLTEEEKEEHPEWDFILDCPLPDDGQRILVNIKYKGHEAVQLDEYYDDDGSYLDSGYEIGTEANAWMPLPEPWREKSMDERTYETCRYSRRTWDLEPCDSCTIGGETSHWEPLEEPWKENEYDEG